MGFRAEKHQRHFQPKQDVEILQLGSSPKPWEPVKFSHLRKAISSNQPLAPFLRDIWLEFAQSLPGFADFTEERPQGPLERLKLANQLEGARQLKAEEDEEAARKKPKLDVPHLVWPGKDEFEPASPAKYSVRIAGAQHDFLFVPKEGASRLFVLFSGYADRNHVTPPLFQRWSWADRFPGHCLFFSDPGLHKDATLPIGYYAGDSERDYLEVISEFASQFAERLDIEPQHIVTYGSSAGGFASLRSAQFFTGATHIAINPQTHLPNHQGWKINRVAKTLYGQDSFSELSPSESGRFSVHRPEVLKNAGRLMVLQNLADEHHYQKHYLPFIDFVSGQSAEDKLTTYEFTHGGGHRAGETREVFETILSFVTSPNRNSSAEMT